MAGLSSPSGEGTIGIGLDSCVMRTRHDGIYLIQTTDFFYPLVDDPYMQGKIACANVLSDLYAMGVSDCDNMLMLLGVSNRLTQRQRDVVTPLVIKGFGDLCNEAGSSCNGGQSVINPWFIIGGVATSVCKKSEFIMPDQAEAGDVLVLTKPLGTQIAVNAHQWCEEPGGKWWKAVQNVVTKEEVVEAYQAATRSMARLNRTAALLMRKYEAHGATDVTGFGILGHAQNLVSCQKNSVNFSLHTLPILNKMSIVATTAANAGLDFKLHAGYSAETSGGLLVALPQEQAKAFCQELEERDASPAWIIGDVTTGERKALISPNFQVIDVENQAV